MATIIAAILILAVFAIGTMQCAWNMSTGDWVALLTFLIAIIATAVAYSELRESNKIKTSEHLKSMLIDLSTPDLLDTLFNIHYAEVSNPQNIWYNRTFYNTTLEKKVDYLFNYISYIIYMLKHKRISKEEFAVFLYDIDLLLRKTQVIEYLWNTFHNSTQNEMPCPFRHLIGYMYVMIFGPENRTRFRSSATSYMGISMSKYVDFESCLPTTKNPGETDDDFEKRKADYSKMYNVDNVLKEDVLYCVLGLSCMEEKWGDYENDIKKFYSSRQKSP